MSRREDFPRSASGKIDLGAIMRAEREAERLREAAERAAQDLPVVCDLCGATWPAWRFQIHRLKICNGCGFGTRLPNFGVGFAANADDDAALRELLVVVGHLWRETHATPRA